MLFEVFSTVFDMISESIMTTLVLMLSNGWMTIFVKYDIDDGLDLYAPIMMIIMMIHVMFGALTYVD